MSQFRKRSNGYLPNMPVTVEFDSKSLLTLILFVFPATLAVAFLDLQAGELVRDRKRVSITNVAQSEKSSRHKTLHIE